MTTATFIGTGTINYDLGDQIDPVDTSVYDQEEILWKKHVEKAWKQEEATTTTSLFSIDFSPVDHPIAFDSLIQLNAIARLPDDWDSYGSPRLSNELHINARNFVDSLKILEKFFVLETPDIVPVSGGGVQFEWQSAGRELEIEFSNPDEIAYLKVFEDERMEEGVFPIEDLEIEVEKLIAWLFSN